MADLDDFFAKKDRKKNKGKRFATADEIARKLEETGKRAEKLKKEKTQQSTEVDEQGNAVQDEDEWREFEEEKKDYSGLKIQNLTLAEYDSGEEGNSPGEGEDEGGMEENEAGEMVPKKKSQGPWKVVASQGGAEGETAPKAGGGGGGGGGETTGGGESEEESPRPPAAGLSHVQGGSYVPPALRQASRQQQQQPAPGSVYQGRFRKKVAPDVKSEELFPTLSAALSAESSASSNPWAKRRSDGPGGGAATGGFEEVRNSRSHTARYEPPHLQNRSLALGNKYGALNEQS